MAATAQGDEADHAGRLRRGLPRDLGGEAIGDFGANQPAIRHGQNFNHHCDLPWLNRWTGFRRQIGKPVRQQLPT